jgi:hypothetical protein
MEETLHQENDASQEQELAQGDINSQNPAQSETETETKTEETVPLPRFKQIYSSLKETERLLAEERKRNQTQTQTQTQSPNEVKKPEYDEFDTEQGYIEALVEWQQSKTFEKIQRDQKNAQKEKTRQQLLDKAAAQTALAVSKDPNFLENATLPGPLEDLVLGSEQFIPLCYHFKQNPEDAHRLMELKESNPIQAAKEIGKLEMKLKGPQRATQTNAPNNTNPINSPGAPEFDPNNTKNDMNQFASWWYKENRNKH